MDGYHNHGRHSFPNWDCPVCAELKQLRQDKAELVAALREIQRKRAKSMIEDCAYQGPPPKTWVKETAPRYEGYNQALKECQIIAKAALANARKES